METTCRVTITLHLQSGILNMRQTQRPQPLRAKCWYESYIEVVAEVMPPRETSTSKAVCICFMVTATRKEPPGMEALVRSEN